MARQRLPEHILKLLREARDYATLETASFDWPDSTMTATCRSGNFSGRPNTFIKDRVKNHHRTYIIYPLDRAIAWGEGKDASE